MPNLFPTSTVTATPEIDTQLEQNKVTSYGKELAFDFVAGDFIYQDGKPVVVEGIEALKVWIEKTLLTARYRFLAYSRNYGCELDEIIGYDLSRAVLESEIPRLIKEALLVDNRIQDVRDFIIERGGDWLKVSFTVITALGDTYRQEVNV